MTHAVGRTCSHRRGSAVGPPRKRGARRGSGGPSSEEGARETRPALRGSRPTRPPPHAGLAGAHHGNHPHPLLHGPAHGEVVAGDAGGERGHRQVGADGGQAGEPEHRRLPGAGRALQLLHDLGHAAGWARARRGLGVRGCRAGPRTGVGPRSPARPHEPPRGCSLHPPPHTNPQGLASRLSISTPTHAVPAANPLPPFSLLSPAGVLEKPLEKKSGRNYGPPGTKKLIYFIDDMNMPEVDKYGTVAPHTLIRQHMDHKHW